jgi:hypothetical protein
MSLHRVTQFKAMIVISLVTLKEAAKLQLVFKKPASGAGLLNKSSHLAAALGVTKFITNTVMNFVTICCDT